MNAWTKHPAVTTGGKPHFFRHKEWRTSVVWNRSLEGWIAVRDFDEVLFAELFETSDAAMKAVEKMKGK